MQNGKQKNAKHKLHQEKDHHREKQPGEALGGGLKARKGAKRLRFTWVACKASQVNLSLFVLSLPSNLLLKAFSGCFCLLRVFFTGARQLPKKARLGWSGRNINHFIYCFAFLCFTFSCFAFCVSLFPVSHFLFRILVVLKAGCLTTIPFFLVGVTVSLCLRF